MMYTEEEVVILMTKAFETGFKQYEIVEAGLEGKETDISFELLDLCTFKNKNIIIDNTNLTQAYIKVWLGQFKQHSRITDVKFKLFDCDLRQAKIRVWERDYLSTNDPNKVDYIDKQYQQYQSIKKWILETYPDNIIK